MSDDINRICQIKFLTKQDRINSYILKYGNLEEPDTAYFEEDLYGLLRDKNYHLREMRRCEKELARATSEDEKEKIQKELDDNREYLKVALAQLSETARQLDPLYDQLYEFLDLDD